MKIFLGFLSLLLSCESFAQTTPFQTFLLGSPAASALGGSEAMYCSQSGSSTQCTPNQLLTFINTNGSPNLVNSTGTLPAARLPAFTGDITTSAGSSATTLATVNSNVGSFTSANITVNAKGLITAAANGSAGSSGANPTGTVGLTTVNGSATTFLRSDGAPPLSQSIVPTWTGAHTFTPASTTAPITVNQISTTPQGILVAGGASTSTNILITAVSGASASIDLEGNGQTSSNPNYIRTTPAGNLALGVNNADAFTINATTGAATLVNSTPTLFLNQSGAGTNLGAWSVGVASGVFSIVTNTDALAAGVNVMTATRGTTTNVSNITLGNTTSNPTFTLAGTGALTTGASITSGGVIKSVAGSASSPGFNFAGSTSSGLYVVATNQPAISANNTEAALFTSTAETFFGTAVNLPNIPASSAATTGTVCWTTGGALSVDTTVACLVSTIKAKQEVKSLDAGISEVMKFHPVSYDLKPEFNPEHLGRQVGLIAEEVDTIDPRLVGLDSNGDVKGVRYMQLTAVLIKAIQQQQLEIYVLFLWCSMLTIMSFYKICRR